jgi:sarcosine oxidase subunit gamma
MADTITRRSPLDARSEELAQLPIDARELPKLAQLNLRIEAGSTAGAAIGAVLGAPLPTLPCTAIRTGDFELLWLGPDEWLVLAPAGEEVPLCTALRTAIGDSPGAVTDVSAQRTGLRLSGAGVRDVLAHGCSIDLHPSVAPDGSCVQTLLAQAGVVIVVRDADAAEFLLLVRASFADYLLDWLIDACIEVQ